MTGAARAPDLSALSLPALRELDILLAGAVAIRERAEGHGLAARVDLVMDGGEMTLGAYVCGPDGGDAAQSELT